MGKFSNMKHPVKTILLLLPLLACFIGFGWVQFLKLRQNSWLYPVEDAFIGAPGEAIIAKSTNRRDGDLQIFDLTMTRPDGKTIDETTVSIDWDMRGGGFVAAMQADNDSELEIVVADASRNSANNYYLDIVADADGATRIERKPLHKAHALIQERISAWFENNLRTPTALAILMVLTLVFYLLYFLFRILSWLTQGLWAAIRKLKIER